MRSGKAALLLIAEALWFIVPAVPPVLGAQGASLKPAKYRTLNPLAGAQVTGSRCRCMHTAPGVLVLHEASPERHGLHRLCK